MELIREIDHPSKWLMQLKAGDIDKGRLKERHSDLSFSVMLAKYNKRYGRKRNIFIHYHFNSDTKVIVLVCETWENYLKNKTNKEHGRDWRKKIPSEYL